MLSKGKKKSSAAKSPKARRRPEDSVDKKAGKKSKYSLSAIRTQIEHTVKAKKIMQFIRNSTKTIPQLLTKEQSKRLLPKL